MDDGDIVVRLRQVADAAEDMEAVMFRRAADEIERLRTLLRRVREMTSDVLQSLENDQDEADEDT